MKEAEMVRTDRKYGIHVEIPNSINQLGSFEYGQSTYDDVHV